MIQEIIKRLKLEKHRKKEYKNGKKSNLIYHESMEVV
jgi:hypothetical protein